MAGNAAKGGHQCAVSGEEVVRAVGNVAAPAEKVDGVAVILAFIHTLDDVGILGDAVPDGTGHAA